MKNKHKILAIFAVTALSVFALMIVLSAPRSFLTAQVGPPVDLCTAGLDDDDGSGDGILDLTATETVFGGGGYDGEDIIISGCTIAIDGAHSFHSIDINTGGVLTHSTGTTDKPVLSISGDIMIDGASSINVDNKGCPEGSGYDVNTSTCIHQGGGGYGVEINGRGGGGAHGGDGGRSRGNAIGGAAFGSLQAPVEYGGGGASYSGGTNGAAGGGAIRLIITGTLTVDGTISANGQTSTGPGDNGGGAGAGGSVYITTGSITTVGTGVIRANGGVADTDGQKAGAGGGGRIAVIYTTADNFTGSGTYEAFGLDGGLNNTYYAAAGTVFVKQSAASTGDLVIDNNGNTPRAAYTPIREASSTFDNFTIQGGAYAQFTNTTGTTSLTVNNPVTMTGGSRMYMQTSDVTVSAPEINMNSASIYANNYLYVQTFTIPIVNLVSSSRFDGSFLTINASTINVDATSLITGDSQGCPEGSGYDVNTGTCIHQGGGGYGVEINSRGGGGAHGGDGGRSRGNAIGGAAFGSIEAPVEYGGGGASYDGGTNGAAGGGAIRLDVSGTLTVNGTISANGQTSTGPGDNGGGAGAGGSVYITTGSITTVGTGVIRANGGVADTDGQKAGAGGGGRISVIYTTADNFTGSGAYEAFGLDGGLNNTYYASAGTIFVKQSAASYGDLVIDNNGNTPRAAYTPIREASSTFDNFTIQGGAYAQFTNTTGTTSLTVNNPVTMTGGSRMYMQTSDVTVSAPEINMNSASIYANNYLYAQTFTIPIVNLVSSSRFDGSFLTINASTINVDATSLITGDSQGCPEGSGYDVNTSTCINQGGGGYGVEINGRGGGGAHGGDGGRSRGNAIGGAAFGSLQAPVEYGGGGASYSGGTNGAAGGGAIRLDVSGTLTVDGTISANGQTSTGPGNNGGGAGAGGSVYITTGSITTVGTGVIRANGGVAGTAGQKAGAGGGGRIAVIYTTADNFTGSGTYEAFGLDGGLNNTYYASAGTVFVKQSTASYGDLVIDNNGNAPRAAYTPLFNGLLTGIEVNNLSVINGAILVVGPPGICNPNALVIHGTITTTGGTVNKPLLDSYGVHCLDRVHTYNLTNATKAGGIVGSHALTTPVSDINNYSFDQKFTDTSESRLVFALHTDLVYDSGSSFAIDMSNLDYDADGVKTVIDISVTPGGLADFHSIYIPNNNGGAGVFVCPNATTLAAIVDACAGIVRFSTGDGWGPKAVGLSTVTVSLVNSTDTGAGVDLYKAEGLKTSGLGPINTVQFVSATGGSTEGAAVADIEVTLVVAQPGTTNVNYAVTGGTAIGGAEDFTLANGTLSFVSPDVSELIPGFSINDDLLRELDTETIEITLSSPDNGVLLGSTTLHTYTITDDETMTVSLNNGIALLQLGNDLNSLVDINNTGGLTAGTTAAYTWTVDPDGAGVSPAENLMVLNVPFSYDPTNNTNSDNIKDFSGGGNDGTYPGGGADPTVMDTGCQVGDCMSFDGAGDNVVVPNNASLQLSEWTISAWVKKNAGATMGIVSKGVDSSDFRNYQLAINGGAFYGMYEDASGTDAVAVTSAALTNGVWYHGVFVYDGARSILYVDGVEVDNQVQTISPKTSQTSDVFVGRYPAGWNFDGLIDEVQIYPRALSGPTTNCTADPGSQICRLYNDGLAGAGSPSVIVGDEMTAAEAWGLDVTHMGPVGATVSFGSTVTIFQASIAIECVLCTGAETVRVLVNGVSEGTASWTGSAWSLPVLSLDASDIVLVYIDSNGGIQAVAVTKYDGTGDVTGMELLVDTLTIGSDDATTVSTTDLAGSGFASDTDIDFVISGVNNDLTIGVGMSISLMGTVGSSFTPDAGSVISLDGDFSNTGNFVHNGGTVKFTGIGTSTITGATTWNDLIVDTSLELAGKTLLFQAGVTQVIDAGGKLSIVGDVGKEVWLHSTVDQTKWNITHTDASVGNIDYADVRDGGCVASAIISLTNSVDNTTGTSTNDVCWDFATLVDSGGRRWTGENILVTRDYSIQIGQSSQLIRGVDLDKSTEITGLVFTNLNDPALEILSQDVRVETGGFTAFISQIYDGISNFFTASIVGSLAYQLDPEPEPTHGVSSGIPGAEAYFTPSEEGDYLFNVEASHPEGENTTGTFTVSVLSGSSGTDRESGQLKPSAVNCGQFDEENEYWSRLYYVETGDEELDTILDDIQYRIKNDIPAECLKLFSEGEVPQPVVVDKSQDVDQYHKKLREIYWNSLHQDVVLTDEIRAFVTEFFIVYDRKETELKEKFQSDLEVLHYGDFYDFPNASRFGKFGIENVEMINQLGNIFSGLISNELLGSYLNLVKAHAILAMLRIYEDPEGIFYVLSERKDYDYLNIPAEFIKKSDLFILIDDILGLSELFGSNNPLAELGIVDDFKNLDGFIGRDDAFTLYYRLRQLNFLLRYEFEQQGFTGDDGAIYHEGKSYSRRVAGRLFSKMLLEKYGSPESIGNLLETLTNDVIMDYWDSWHEFLDRADEPFPTIKRIIFGGQDPVMIFENLKKLSF